MTKELQEFITRDRKITSAEDLQARISNLREQFGSAPDEKARCSAAWFERTATPAQVKTIYGLKIDRVHVEDDFAPIVQTGPYAVETRRP